MAHILLSPKRTSDNSMAEHFSDLLSERGGCIVFGKWLCLLDNPRLSELRSVHCKGNFDYWVADWGRVGYSHVCRFMCGKVFQLFASWIRMKLTLNLTLFRAPDSSQICCEMTEQTIMPQRVGRRMLTIKKVTGNVELRGPSRQHGVVKGSRCELRHSRRVVHMGLRARNIDMDVKI